MSRLVAVWDIDGTLANNSHRASRLVKRCSICLYEPLASSHRAVCPVCHSTDATITQESWDSFLSPELMADDTPYLAALDVLHRLREMNSEIHYITGRSASSAFEVTDLWLKTRVGKQAKEHLFMRSEEDEGVPASVYKSRAVVRLKDKIGSEGVFMFFEDDPHVFPVYNEHGLVIRCPEGLTHFMPPGPPFRESRRRA